MRVLYFAWLRERIGASSEEVTPPDGTDTVAALIDWLKTREERYELAFADLSAIRVAVDQEMSELDASISGAREVALFPPVTGG